jgi:hypothetical protein
MLGFVPVFSGLAAAGGQVTSATVYSGAILGFSEVYKAFFRQKNIIPNKIYAPSPYFAQFILFFKEFLIIFTSHNCK